MKSKRQLQFGESIKRILSEVFLRSDILSFSGSYISILEADVSPDIKNARIFVDIFGNENLHEKIIKKLNENAWHFRQQLSKQLATKGVPEIIFVLDKTQSNAIKMESLISEESKQFKKKPSKKK